MNEYCKKCKLRPNAFLHSDCTRYKKYGSRVEECKDLVVNKSQLEKLKIREKEDKLLKLLEEGFENKYNIGQEVYYIDYGTIITKTTIRDIIPYPEYTEKFVYKVKGKINTISESYLYPTYKAALGVQIADFIKRSQQQAKWFYRQGINAGLTESELEELQKLT